MTRSKETPYLSFFFFQAEDGIRDHCVTGVQTCALPIYVDEQLRVARMEANGRFVEHVERAHKMRAERSGEMNPLRFSAGKRGSQTVEREEIGRASCRERV